MTEKEKTKNNLTELVFILDRSGSMAGMEADTIGGFNAMIEKQKAEEGRAYVSTILFDNTSMVIHDRLDVKEVPPMTRKEYSVRGCTALMDAIGDAIHHIATIHKYARPEDVPAHTLFVITTDGMENASHRYNRISVKKMIEERKSAYHWEFLFLGANIDAEQTAASFGIDADHAADYHCDAAGTALNFDVLSDAISCVRSAPMCDCDSDEDGDDAGPLDASWKERIDADFRGRKSRR